MGNTVDAERSEGDADAAGDGLLWTTVVPCGVTMVVVLPVMEEVEWWWVGELDMEAESRSVEGVVWMEALSKGLRGSKIW